MTDPKSYESTMDAEQPPAYNVASSLRAGQPELPSYQDAERNGPPPSYDSLYGKAKAMREESNGNVDFIKKIIFMIFGTIGFTIFLGLILAIPIAMLVMGVIYLDDCPEERYIPIYLLVAGVFGVLRNLITIGRRCCTRKEEGEEEQKAKPNPIESIIDCFMIGWFIAGNVWIYRTKGDFSEDPNAPNFCDPTLYWFAFWITTATYIVMATGCCCCCFCGLLAFCLGGKKE
ncbi:transmembrane protein 272-like [Littorina saxatilis]|uniref:Transmembrane protein n=1 Tax=Littorina saxatilis TaxID=31220 RepID=A0AAN9B1S1_9CAEN